MNCSLGFVTAIPFHTSAAVKPLLDSSATPFRPEGRLLHLFGDVLSSTSSFLLTRFALSHFFVVFPFRPFQLWIPTFAPLSVELPHPDVIVQPSEMLGDDFVY